MSWKHGLTLGIITGAVAGGLVTALLLPRSQSQQGAPPRGQPAPRGPARRPSELPPEVVKARPLQPSWASAAPPKPRAGGRRPSMEALEKDPALFRKEVEANARSLASSDASVRLDSVRALRRLRAKEEAPRVRALLGDPNPAVRRAAATTAGYFSDPEAFEEVLKLAREDRDSSVRAAAISSLITTGGRKNERTAAVLTEDLTSTDPHVRLAAVTAMNLLDWSLVGEKEKAVLKDLAVNDGLYQEMGDLRMYPVRDAARTLLLAHGIQVGGE